MGRYMRRDKAEQVRSGAWQAQQHVAGILAVVDVHESVLDGREGGHGVAVGASHGLRDDSIHHSKVDQLWRRDLERLCGLHIRGH